MSTEIKMGLFALRPFNVQYQERTWWVHLDDGNGEPLCGERKQGYNLVPELITTDNPHVCGPCGLIAEAATQKIEDKATYVELERVRACLAIGGFGEWEPGVAP